VTHAHSNEIDEQHDDCQRRRPHLVNNEPLHQRKRRRDEEVENDHERTSEINAETRRVPARTERSTYEAGIMSALTRICPRSSPANQRVVA